jgi:hypothetical protein
MADPRLVLRRIRSVGVEVPMKLLLGTSAGVIRAASPAGRRSCPIARGQESSGTKER